LDDGLCTLFIRHTPASLLVQENADPPAARDLEAWLDRLAPENDALDTHLRGAPDGVPAHIPAAPTATPRSTPIAGGRPALGPRPGIYVWEHRRRGSAREVVVHVSD